MVMGFRIVSLQMEEGKLCIVAYCIILGHIQCVGLSLHYIMGRRLILIFRISSLDLIQNSLETSVYEVDEYGI